MSKWQFQVSELKVPLMLQNDQYQALDRFSYEDIGKYCWKMENGVLNIKFYKCSELYSVN